MRFRAPAVDLQRLAENVKRVAELEKGLDATIAQLAIDMPGSAEAVAAAGISFRAQVNRSASMIELGTAAVDALRRGGWLLSHPATRLAELVAEENARTAVAAAERENRDDAKRSSANDNSDIPDDWAV